MKKGLIMILCVAVCGSYTAAQKTSDEVRSILSLQQQAWNEGDIDEFMAYYWQSEDMTFQSGNNRLSGWHALLERYKTNYSGDKMGKLKFTDLDIRILNEDVAYVLGRFNLVRGEEKLQGLFTIILKHFPSGWQIIHDHTSS